MCLWFFWINFLKKFLAQFLLIIEKATTTKIININIQLNGCLTNSIAPSEISFIEIASPVRRILFSTSSPSCESIFTWYSPEGAAKKYFFDSPTFKIASIFNDSFPIFTRTVLLYITFPVFVIITVLFIISVFIFSYSSILKEDSAVIWFEIATIFHSPGSCWSFILYSM